MDINNLKAYEIAAMIRSKELSAVEVLEANLQRISEVDGRPGTIDGGEITKEDEAKVHAFINVTEERARKQAQEVDKKIAYGENPGALAGVPFSVKDIFAVKGTLTTAASKILANFRSPYSATSVKRMEKAGGLISSPSAPSTVPSLRLERFGRGFVKLLPRIRSFSWTR